MKKYEFDWLKKCRGCQTKIFNREYTILDNSVVKFLEVIEWNDIEKYRNFLNEHSENINLTFFDHYDTKMPPHFKELVPKTHPNLIELMKICTVKKNPNTMS